MQTKSADIDWSLVLKMLAGGALTGGGLAAATSAFRHIDSLQHKVKRQQDTSQDDDILYLNLPPKKASANAATFATGGLAGILGTYLAYNLVRGQVQKMRKKELQKELDQSQQVYLGGLTKQASQFPVVSKVVGTGYLAALMAALGSAVITNRVLQKQFPAIKPPNRDKPRKIVLRTGKEEAAVEAPDKVTPDMVEGMMHTHLQQTKAASESGFADLVAAAAQGRCNEIYNNSWDLDLMFDTVKGARFTKVSSFHERLAVTWLSNQPQISAAITPLLAAELQTTTPGWHKLASHIEPEFHDDLANYFADLVPEWRNAVHVPVTARIKVAASFGDGSPLDHMNLSDALKYILSNQQSETAPKEQPSTDARKRPINVPTSEDSTAVEVEDDASLAFLRRHGSEIERALVKA